MKLVLYSVPEQVDEVLMLVPDDYDEAYAADEAAAYLGVEAEALKVEFVLDVEDAPASSMYRPYVG